MHRRSDCFLSLEVADVSCLVRIKGQIADRSNQRIDTTSDVAQEQVSQGPGAIALRLQGGEVDDQAADPAEEESQQKTNELLIVHIVVPFEVWIFVLDASTISLYKEFREMSIDF